jgi:uncharacterized membrane protein
MMNINKNRWLVYSIAAAFCWGVWGVLAKFISSDITPFVNHFLFTVGMLFTLPFIIKKCKRKDANTKGIFYGIISGVFAVIGNIAVYKAFASGGLAAIVIPVTNLYPLITIIIALAIFKEKLNWMNVIGLLLAIPAILILSGEPLLFSDPASFFRKMGLNVWMVYSLVALLFWGIFSAAQKVTTNYVSTAWSYLSFIVSSVLITLVFLFMGYLNINYSTTTLVIGSVAGLLNGLGVLASFAAYSSEGKASQVTTVAGALQPVFTIVLSVLFLKEKFSMMEFVGILVAIISALALSNETKAKTDMVQNTETVAV